MINRETHTVLPPRLVSITLGILILVQSIVSANEEAETPGQLMPMIPIPIDERKPTRIIDFALRIVNRTPVKRPFFGPYARKAAVLQLGGKSWNNFGVYGASSEWPPLENDRAYIAPRTDITFFLNLESNFIEKTGFVGLQMGDSATLIIDKSWQTSATISFLDSNTVRMKYGDPIKESPIGGEVIDKLTGQGKQIRVRSWPYVSQNGMIDVTKSSGFRINLNNTGVFLLLNLSNPGDQNVAVGKKFLSSISWKPHRHLSSRRSNTYVQVLELHEQEDAIMELPVFSSVKVAIPFPKDVVIQAMHEHEELDLVFEEVPEICYHLRRIDAYTIEFIGLEN